ncbi:MAG: type I DNA topoisomerase [Chlamydiales bacterium]
MKKALIIVESPTKIKTIKKFLGRNYNLASSVGHIRDLPVKKFGIDLENDFTPEYESLPDKKDVIAKLKKEAKEADIVYLCPDPDREGEAIAWHLASILPKGTKCKRVTFNAITKNAVEEALKHPRDIDQNLVNAQQARRLVDRIVGYKISPILHRRIQSGRDGFLSAGRVQSVALKLVVDREREIDAFVPVEYWTIGCDLQRKGEKKAFRATLHSIDGKRIEKEEKKGCITISNEKKATEIFKKLEKSKYTLTKLEKKEKKRRPVPPFITSSMQQEASRYYGYAASRTMGIAQSLYEGVDLGNEGAEGLITYMRTDSVRIDKEAFGPSRSFIEKTYGKRYLPKDPQQYSTKKGAQDAHEAIRPTNFNLHPQKIKSYLTADQFKLYQLIWRRFIASQMLPAIYDTVSSDIETDNNMLLRATGSILKFDGYLRAYREGSDDKEEDEEKLLPPTLKEGDILDFLQVEKTQSFTKPPARFTEASLIKELEKSGIGRPSTYATIMNKIQSKDYTVKEKLTLRPTELGKIIAAMLETHFTMIMNVAFTAHMEDDLDVIAEGKKDWKKFLKEFWGEFEPVLEKAVKEAHVPKEMTDIDCPDCGSKLQKIWAKNKYFYGCSKYPDCKYTTAIEALDFDKSDYAEDFEWEQDCPKCKSPMTLRHGRFGPFLGCSKYPDCRGIVNIPKKGDPKQEDLPDCPAIGCEGKINQRKSRFGKAFFSCSNYPDCDVIANSVEEMEKKYHNHPKTAYVKRPRKKGAKGRSQPLYTPSKELADIIGKEDVTRGEATKKLWEYIKKHDLQDEKNKRLIVPDKKMAAIFGNNEPLDMMQLSRVLSKNFKK